MNLSSRIEQLPVEDWAAAAARIVRRVRRRVVRKPARSLGALAAVVAIAAIASNALWEQEGSHPAPIWGSAETADKGTRLVAAHSPPSGGPAELVEAGMPDEMVYRVQTALVEAGYFNSQPDGMLTQETRESIELFEVDRGLPVTGEPSVALLAAFTEETVAAEESETLTVASVIEDRESAEVPQRGSQATIGTVAEIQAALNKTGHGPLTVDGVMGPRTREALDAFAMAHGLAAEGVTPAVLRALAQETR